MAGIMIIVDSLLNLLASIFSDGKSCCGRLFMNI